MNSNKKKLKIPSSLPYSPPLPTENEIKEILAKYRNKLKFQPRDKKEFLNSEDKQKVLLIISEEKCVKEIFVTQSEKSTANQPTYCFHLLETNGKVQPISVRYCFEELEKNQQQQRKEITGNIIIKQTNDNKITQDEAEMIKKVEEKINELRILIKNESNIKIRSNYLEKSNMYIKKLEVFKKSKENLLEKYSEKRIQSFINIEMDRFKLDLPVYSVKFDLISHIKKNKITLIYGETGSGKTTQIPQYISEELKEFFGNKSVVVSQPRKIAVKNLTDRVREEQKITSNADDGKIEYNKTQKNTKKPKQNKDKEPEIVFMLDRDLLDKYVEDRSLSKYGCIIIDEAHERNVNTDVLLGFLLKLSSERHDNFRIIVMTATMDEDLFEKYFQTPIFKIPGRPFQVKTEYRPPTNKNPLETIFDLIKKDIFDKNYKIKREYDGHILIFTSGEDDIKYLYNKLLRWVGWTRNRDKYHVFQLHSKITSDQQEAIYKTYDKNVRKIILSTRIAESSITINNVKVIIDIGYDLIEVYDRTKKITKIEKRWITQSQCKQRKGRAGRTTSGFCFRIFSKEDFQLMEKFKKSEILNINSDLVVLKLKQLGVQDVKSFDYLEPPPIESLNSSLQFMEEIGAFDKENKLSKLGSLMGLLPTEPALSRIIIESKRQDCYEEILEIVAVMTYEKSLFCKKTFYDNDNRENKILEKTEFYDETSDLIIFKNIYDKFLEKGGKGQSWCEENNINAESLKQAQVLKEEIQNIFLKSQSNHFIDSYLSQNRSESKKFDLKSRIIICFLSAMFDNICIYTQHPKIGYMLLGRNMIVKLDDNSTFSMQAKYPKWIIASEFIQGDSHYFARILSEINIEMIEQIVPKSFFERNNLKELNSLETPIFKKHVLYDQPTRVISAFIKKNSDKIIEFFNKYKDEYFDFCNQKNTIQIWAMNNLETIKEHLLEIIENLLEKSKNEIIEYNWLGETRVLISNGFEVKNILFAGQYRKLVFNFLNITENSLNRLLEEHGIRCLSRDLSSLNYPEEIKGEVFTETPEDCEKLAKVLSSLFVVKQTITDSALDNKQINCSVKIEWYLGEKCEDNKTLLIFEDRSRAIDFKKTLNAIFSGNPYLIINNRNHELAVDIHKNDPNIILSWKKGYSNIEISEEEFRKSINILFEYCGIVPKEMYALRKGTEPDEIFKENEWIENIKKACNIFKPEGYLFTFNNETETAEKYKKEVTLEFLNPESLLEFQNNYAKNPEPVLILPHKSFKLNIKYCYKWEKDVNIKIFNCLQNKISELIKKIYLRTERKVLLKYPYYQLFEAMKYSELRDKITLFIEGEDFEKSTWAVEEIQTLLQGNIFVEKDKRKLGFFLSEEGMNMMARVYQDKKVFIEYDSAKNIVRMYGEEINITEVQKDLSELFKKSSFQFKKISLKGKNILSLLINNKAKWTELYERFSNKLQIFPKFSLRQIEIEGSPEEIQEFEEDLNQYLPDKNESLVKKADECGICLGEITEPFLFDTCRHKFCQVCLCEMLENITSFPLQCLDCNRLLSLEDVKELVSPELLKSVYRKSIENFIQKNKEKYHFCPSRECNQILNLKNFKKDPKAKKNIVACDSCKKRICMGCWKVEHIGMSCKSELDPEILKKYHLRSCPKCKLVIEKSDGCNHVHCKPPYGCDSHICWQCGKLFDCSDKCYAHMRAENHNSITMADFQ